ncbi:MAG TPA: hypothetical protein VFJ16_26630 [Longimicrobium sp.]|nr:hypothetical protein [Longimicrobium sp.]
MQSAVMNPVPAWSAVAREQFRSVGLSLRREAIVAGGCMGLATLWLSYLHVNSGGAGIPFAPQAGIPVAVLALLIPMAVWKGEEPARRGYHRAMPVSHAAHAVMRSLSGLGWMMAAVAGYFAWLAGVSAMTGGEVMIGSQPYQWLVPFTGGAVMYLLGSALTLVTAHPWRWLGGALVAYMFMGAMRVADGTRSLFELVNTVIDGRYGLFTVLSGMSRTHGLYSPHVASAPVWMLATWMWLAVAITLFLFAAYRQPER